MMQQTMLIPKVIDETLLILPELSLSLSLLSSLQLSLFSLSLSLSFFLSMCAYVLLVQLLLTPDWLLFDRYLTTIILVVVPTLHTPTLCVPRSLVPSPLPLLT
jgi:hypothetical protein